MEFQEYRDTLHREQQGSLAWLGRVARGEEPLEWRVPRSLALKVSSVGKLRPFHGDTVVFELSKEDLEACAEVQRQVTEGLEDLFAEPLDPRDLHVTLHDLSNGPLLPELERAMDRNERLCHDIFRTLPDEVVRLEPVSLFDCLNISVLLGYAPASLRDHRVLQEAYGRFDEVVKLDYFLRPHVTMAYFRTRVPGIAEVEELYRRLRRTGPLPSLTLSLRNLAYQRFTDMNSYQTRFTASASGPRAGGSTRPA